MAEGQIWSAHAGRYVTPGETVILKCDSGDSVPVTLLKSDGFSVYTLEDGQTRFTHWCSLRDVVPMVR